MTAKDRRGAGRAKYARLLASHPLASYDRAREAPEKPLGHLLFSLYQERHPGLPMEVDRFVHDDCVFLYDSGGQRWLRLSRDTVHAYDIGHFVPHGVGGPTRINLFRQERRLNRGWSEAGRTYRWLERYVAARPGTFYFVRPVYGDLSDTPQFLEWGALIEAAEVKRLAPEVARRPQLEIVTPAPPRSGIQAAWLLGWFENFPPGAERLDLDPPEPLADRARGKAGRRPASTAS